MSHTTRQRQLLVAGVVTILVAAIALINNFLEDEVLTAWVGIMGMVLVALTFLWAYLQKNEIWAGIGIYVGSAIAFFIFFVTQISKENMAFLTAWLPSGEGSVVRSCHCNYCWGCAVVPCNDG
jgi:energy-coupling factor transporter transmembrane protein EcfT